jgi:hypothetical protein
MMLFTTTDIENQRYSCITLYYLKRVRPKITADFRNPSYSFWLRSNDPGCFCEFCLALIKGIFL